jgi:DsbC/DsbD-like thiol-disulfide interchange protein
MFRRTNCAILAVLSLTLVSCSQSTKTGTVAEEVTTVDAGAEEATTADIAVEQTATSPVVTQSTDGLVAASLEPDVRQLRPGTVFSVSVRMQIAPGWHIYAVDKPAGTNSRTSLKIEAPEVIAQDGEWILPEPSLVVAGLEKRNFIYHGEPTFVCLLRVAADAEPGERTIRCRLRYQACDRFSCRPPEEMVLATTVQFGK